MSMGSRKKVRLGSSEGYTLLELLVVLAIIALLVGFVAPKMMGYLGRAKADAAKVQLHNVSTAIELYRLDAGAYPTEAEGLRALLEKPGAADHWNGPYLTRADGILDPWGQPFIYKQPGQHGDYDLMSYGADKKPGGEGDDADVTSW
jgi:general secretion pathway protein G